MYEMCLNVEHAYRLVRSCEKFVPALAYLFCLALPGSCLARFAYFLADLCTLSKKQETNKNTAAATDHSLPSPTSLLAFSLFLLSCAKKIGGSRNPVHALLLVTVHFRTKREYNAYFSQNKTHGKVISQIQN